MLAHQNKYVSTTSAFNKFRVFLNATHAAVIFTLLLFTTLAQAGQVSLAWNPSSSPDVGGYKVVYGLASGTYTSTVDVGKQTSTTVANLDDSKTYYFAARAYNTARTVESANSNEVSKPASTTAPPVAAPTASFSATSRSGNAPLAVSFTNLSGGSVNTWAWNFGDGGTSNTASPSHTYTTVRHLFRQPDRYWPGRQQHRNQEQLHHGFPQHQHGRRRQYWRG